MPAPTITSQVLQNDGRYLVTLSNGAQFYTAAGEPFGLGWASTGTPTPVAASATSVTILAANPARQGGSVYNDSTATLYLLLGTGAASATVYTVPMTAGAYYEVPSIYRGPIVGLWSSATGNARVTEFT